MRYLILAFLAISFRAMLAPAAEPISIHSPGFPPSTLDAEGRLVEDWGSLGVTLSGEGVVDGPTVLQAVKLDDVIPAAQAATNRGAVRLIRTAFRAPAFPSGVDVLTLRVEEARGQPAEVMLGLDLPANAAIGLRTVRLGGRIVLTLPDESLANRPMREWGYCDDRSCIALRSSPRAPRRSCSACARATGPKPASGPCPAAWKAPPHKPWTR